VGKLTQLEKAIAAIDGEIDVLQLALAKLRSQEAKQPKRKKKSEPAAPAAQAAEASGVGSSFYR